jgi:formylmethanofuran:tetrahydromethanopterin formyltransferase
MSNDPNQQPYERDRLVDKPGIIGARWWHAALADQDAQIARRTAIRNILIAGGVIAGFGAMLAMCAKVASSRYVLMRERSSTNIGRRAERLNYERVSEKSGG